MKKLYLVAVPVLLLASSCSRYYYQPNAVNAPMFTNGNQFHIAGSGSSSDYEVNGDGGKSKKFDLQLAYSPIKHLGVIGNYSTWSFRPDVIDFSKAHVDADAHLAELGIGGYLTSGQGFSKFVSDLYVGGGAGSIKSDVNMDVRRIFIQPGIGFRHPIVEVGLNMRISNVKFSNLDDNGRGVGYLEGRNLIDVQRNRNITEGSHWFWEPAITTRIGYKFIKAQFQWAFANEITHVPWNYDGSRFTVGLHLNVEDIIAMSQGKK